MLDDYGSHKDVIAAREKDIAAEKDLRETVAEVVAFMHHPQGQWEDDIWNAYEGDPRYTFDQTKPQVNKAWAEMAANEYASTTQPSGGGATEEVANIIDDKIRDIYNVSSFDDVSTKAGKRMIATGFAAWRLFSGYVGESFHQELQIELVNNAHERVWFDCYSEKQTREDAYHVHVDSALSKTYCEKKWKDREAFESLGQPLEGSNTYEHKPEDIIVVSELYYKKAYKKTLYLIDDEEQSVVDEETLASLGLTPESPLIISSRECDAFKVYSRKYDAAGWLGKEKETVFKHLPIIAEYANFDVVENKVTYEGIVEPIMDACRVFNYAESRKVKESCLSAAEKIFVDERSVTVGNKRDLETLHLSNKPVITYRSVDEKGNPITPPFKIGGVNPNPGVSELSENMIRNIELTSGLPNEITVLQNTTKDSDFRFDQRSSMGQLGTFEYYRSHKVALEYSLKVMLGAFPRVYDSERLIRSLGEDGQSKQIRINYLQDGKLMNSLKTGNYDITVKVGPSFEDRKTETNTRILELGDHVPGIVERNADILTSNIDAPGMRSVADRERERLFNAGAIPQSQMTDQEKQALAVKMNQPQPPDPAVILAQAEMGKAQAELQREEIRRQTELIKLQQLQRQQQVNEIKEQFDMQLKAAKQQMDEQAQAIDNLKKLVEAKKIYTESAAPDPATLRSQEQDIQQAQAAV